VLTNVIYTEDLTIDYPFTESQFNDIIQALYERNGQLLKKLFDSIKDNTYIIMNHTPKAQKKATEAFHYNKEILETISYKISFDNHPNRYNKAGKIKSLNIEQACLIHALKRSEDISIISASGRFGSGKSFLLMNYALNALENGEVMRIAYMPNNAETEGAKKTGFKPGDTIEKEMPFMRTFIDIIGSYEKFASLIMQDKLEIFELSSVRGRNFDNTIVYINEAQNISAKHIMLLLSRCGKNSRVFFDGDIDQVDVNGFKGIHNGLELLSHLSTHEKYRNMFTSVELIDIERSEVAKATAFLQETYKRIQYETIQYKNNKRKEE